MSERDGTPGRLVPLMEPARARDVARAWEALAGAYEHADMDFEASAAIARSSWWLNYALVLDRTKK